MKQKFRLHFPPSANTYWRMFKNRIYVSKQAKDYRISVRASVVDQQVKKMRGSLDVKLELYYKGKRKWDLDNRIKQTLDALQYAEVFDDDEQVVRIEAIKNTNSKEHYAIITIKECNNG